MFLNQQAHNVRLNFCLQEPSLFVEASLAKDEEIFSTVTLVVLAMSLVYSIVHTLRLSSAVTGKTLE